MLIVPESADRFTTVGVDHVELAGLNALHPGVGIGNRAILDLVEVRQLRAVGVLLPVIGVLHGREVIVELPLLQLEGPGANQVLVAVVLAVQLGLSRHSQPAAGVQEAG